MNSEGCHASEAPAVDARDLILRVLGVGLVAGSCGVGEAAVYQWLHRGTDHAPVPSARVPAIAAGAVRAGKDFEVGLLWPAMRGFKAAQLAPSAPSAPALGNAGGAHAVAEADAVQSADSGNTIPGPVIGQAADRSPHGNPSEHGAGSASTVLRQFGGVEVGQSDLDPACAADVFERLNAEAVTVTDVNDGPAEGLTGPYFGGHGATIGDARAGVSESRATDQGEGEGREQEAKHKASVAAANAVREVAQ